MPKFQKLLVLIYGKWTIAQSRMADRVDISQRPAIVDQRTRMVDWEGDMVVGRKNRGGLVTRVERATRFLVAGRARNKQASNFTAITHELLHWVPKPLCHSLTLENDTKMQVMNTLPDTKKWRFTSQIRMHPGSVVAMNKSMASSGVTSPNAQISVKSATRRSIRLCWLSTHDRVNVFTASHLTMSLQRCCAVHFELESAKP
jgi:hypothetical protein